jgi:hypothetical protein
MLTTLRARRARRKWAEVVSRLGQRNQEPRAGHVRNSYGGAATLRLRPPFLRIRTARMTLVSSRQHFPGTPGLFFEWL